MSRVHHKGTAPSQRMLRVAELIRHSLAQLLTRGAVDDPVLTGHVISVPEVRMSPDLKLATVYVMPLGGSDLKPVLEAFDRHKKFLRGEIARQVNLRFAPEIRFRADEALAQGARIDALLRDPAVQRDLARKPDEGDAGT